MKYIKQSTLTGEFFIIDILDVYILDVCRTTLNVAKKDARDRMVNEKTL